MTAHDIPPAALDPRDDRVDEAAREQLLARLAVAGRLCPYMRFGQLVCMLTTLAEAAAPGSVYDIEDGELIQAVEELIRAEAGLRSAG